MIDVPSDDAFRFFDQKEWFVSAGPLFETKYRSSVVAGIVLSIGSQLGSVVSILSR